MSNVLKQNQLRTTDQTYLKNLSSFGILAIRERNNMSCVNTVLQECHINLNQSVFPLCQLQVIC